MDTEYVSCLYVYLVSVDGLLFYTEIIRPTYPGPRRAWWYPKVEFVTQGVLVGVGVKCFSNWSVPAARIWLNNKYSVQF